MVINCDRFPSIGIRSGFGSFGFESASRCPKRDKCEGFRLSVTGMQTHATHKWDFNAEL